MSSYCSVWDVFKKYFRYKLFVNYEYCKLFLPTYELYFHSLSVSFEEQMVLILTKSKLSFFFLSWIMIFACVFLCIFAYIFWCYLLTVFVVLRLTFLRKFLWSYIKSASRFIFQKEMFNSFSITCWKECHFPSDLPFFLSQRFTGYICLCLFEGSLFCSIDLHVSPLSLIQILSWSLYLYSQVLQSSEGFKMFTSSILCGIFWVFAFPYKL